VQQFFGEGGTRCYVARTAHFTNPADRSTLTARRASVPLAGSTTTLTAALNEGATTAQLSTTTDIDTGTELFIHDGANAARVTVTSVTGNTVDFTDTPIPPGVNFTNLTATIVLRVVLNLYALNEGEWGDNLRLSVTPSGMVATSIDMPADPAAIPPVPAGLQPGTTQAVLASLTGISMGMTLFITDDVEAARVQVTNIEEGQRRITFIYLSAPPTGVIDHGADVTGIRLGKVSTVLDGGVASGATEAVLRSTEGIEVGSILLFVSEELGNTTASPVTLPRLTDNRDNLVVVTRLAGQRVFFTPGLNAAFPDGTRVTTVDFDLTVYDGNAVVETHTNLSMENTNATDYVEDRINRGATRSRFVRVREAGLGAVPETENDLPARTPSPVRL
jgi:hypothetical protein